MASSLEPVALLVTISRTVLLLLALREAVLHLASLLLVWEDRACPVKRMSQHSNERDSRSA